MVVGGEGGGEVVARGGWERGIGVGNGIDVGVGIGVDGVGVGDSGGRGVEAISYSLSSDAP